MTSLGGKGLPPIHLMIWISLSSCMYILFPQFIHIALHQIRIVEDNLRQKTDVGPYQLSSS
jgi:hypothetical protein